MHKRCKLCFESSKAMSKKTISSKLGTGIHKGCLLGLLCAALLLFFALLVSCTYPQSTNETQPSEASRTSLPAEPIKGIPAERVANNNAIEGISPSDPIESDPEKECYTDERAVVRFLDVGQGDAALISIGNHHMLIDGGPPEVSSFIYSTLERLNINELDAVIITHPDADHCGGIAGALNYAGCDKLYCTVSDYNTRSFKNILQHLASPIIIPAYGDSFQFAGAEVQFINPLSSAEARSNNGSLVCLFTYKDTRFLFSGDAEVESEFAMVQGMYDLHADVLKVGHHGSVSSSSLAFLKEINPTYAVISVGENNYGHPALSVIDNLEKCGAKILRTDEIGTITFVSNGTEIHVESVQEAKGQEEGA